MSDDFFHIDADTLKQGERVFRAGATFVAGADSADRIPPSELPEIAFAGRSNVGKSSLINALVGMKNLARASNTPGRTQQINFFDIGGRLQLADMPGYGYAKAARSQVHAWNTMVSEYLRTRGNLQRLCVLIDARHGVLEADEKAFKIFDDARTAYIIVLTKIDKIKPAELTEVTAAVEKSLLKCRGAFPKVLVTSSEKGTGIPELRAILATI